jgi:hypothetical protein
MEKYKLQGGLVSRTDQRRLLKYYFNYSVDVSVFFGKYKKLYFWLMKLRRFKWTILGLGSNPHNDT